METVTVNTEPYFLGGEHRTIDVGGLRFSIIPQPKGMDIHDGLFEVALIHPTDPEAEIEILGTYLPESQVLVVILQAMASLSRV